MTRTAVTHRELRTRLASLTLRDEHRLQRQLDRVRDGDLSRIEPDITAAEARIAARRAAVPAITYPEQLPVTGRRDDIAAAIAAHQVVIVAGETGSGKTTQIPKICLELGRGIRGAIGHTQPRRLAARTVAERIAEELGTELGDTVGYTVRFTDHAAEHTLVKLMTDGILLAEIQRDRLLRAYDTIIIDEAHERSLNIDFLLGYLKQLLPRRPDLKIVITSATIDPELFARHFADAAGRPAPIVEVSGRSYPVELRYRPLALPAPAAEDEEEDHRPVDRDPVDAICAAVTELFAEGDGDVLVFLSGEREIRDTADALADLKMPRTEILPLYARLSAAEQHRVFAPHTGRRVVLATNVAETSLTVPGIRYVVDPGTARISRYSIRTKVQRLPIEPISQASARQRAGRCGRVADGICIRLYSEDDFESRPTFTDPEILRTNLAAVILQMTALGLGEMERFPFVEAPDNRAVRDGVALLEELGALARRTAEKHTPQDTPATAPEAEHAAPAPDSAAQADPARSGGKRRAPASGPTLTPTGREMARLPVDPRMGRMLVEAHRNGCLAEMLVIVAALSIQDVRERPADQQQAADARHARFTVPNSDFLAYLRLWEYLTGQRRALSANRFRRMCREEFLHYLRIREWQDLYGQLRTITKGMGWSLHEANAEPEAKDDRTGRPGPGPRRRRGHNRPEPEQEAGRQHHPGSPEPRPVEEMTPDTDPWDATAIHQALLSGMLSHIGVREAESREFLGARNAKFMIFPGSSLAKKPPRWVMAAELVETSRLWGRIAARVEPEWAERLAGDLVKRIYSEPHWSAKRGAARAYERVTLYGVPLVTGRPVDYGRIDPEISRELFLRHALVQGEWQTRHEFFQRNRALIDDIADLEQRARRRDILVDDEVLFEFYDRRIPADIVSVRHFDTWWKSAGRQDPHQLDFTTDTVVNDTAKRLDPTDFPDAWRQGELSFPLTYQFEPGQADDGVTVRIPVAQLAHVRAVGFDWLVPGMRAELAAALIKTLPKQLRRTVVPAPDFAAAALRVLTPRAEPLRTGLSRELTRLAATPISAADLDPAALPEHLRMTFAATDADGRVLATSKSLAHLRTRLADQVSASVAAATANAERAPATVWTSESLGTLDATVRSEVGGQTVTGYPALVPESGGVAVRVLKSPAEQAAAMRAGTRALVLDAIPTSVRAVTASLSPADRLVLSQNPYGSVDALVEDCRAAAADQLIAAAGGPVRDPAQFDRLLVALRPKLNEVVTRIIRLVVPVLAEAHEVSTALTGVRESDIAGDVRDQLADLLFDGFVSEWGPVRLRELPRYLRAAGVRLAALPGSAVRDRQAIAEVDTALAAYDQLLTRLSEGRRRSSDITEIWWMIQELRVSLFAQKVGTPYPVSTKRIQKAIAAVRR
ncbi:ATP-dependent RNA helicase HrpA [Nocardia jinanensis]|uniref:ATP-dependent helicase n=1 Tax=Nocardia jinanensis TaxID=382504 RepID=A0A917R8X0_9NOCA|nr:ATP-dependent RNA helicase HrpA [Nocardia jinanensis]GGK95235.1 ATP-dependent helicase [Nocardia jinanensis]